MTDIIDIREKLRDTHAEIENLRQEIGRKPNNPWLVRSLSSLEVRQQHLEEAFNKATVEHGDDVFSYRLVRENTPSFPVAVLGATLTHFQQLLTILLSAVVKGPKDTGRVSHEISQKATLDFGYSFAGSLGLVFTVPNERLLLVDSDLDLAVAGMFEMINASTTAEVAGLAHTYGVAAVRKMYAWANHHALHAVTADIAWRRGDQIRRQIMLQAPQAVALCEAIVAASEVTSNPLSVRGVLVGGDVATRTFHFKFADDTEMSGKLAEGFVSDGALTLGSVYEADLTVFHKTEYAFEKEETWYELRRTKQIQNELNA